MYLTLNGVPLHEPPSTGELFFREAPDGAWRSSQGDMLGDIDIQCVRIHEALAALIFDGIDNYRRQLPHAPMFLAEAGLNSESSISRDLFEKALAQLPTEPTNRS